MEGDLRRVPHLRRGRLRRAEDAAGVPPRVRGWYGDAPRLVASWVPRVDGEPNTEQGFLPQSIGPYTVCDTNISRKCPQVRTFACRLSAYTLHSRPTAAPPQRQPGPPRTRTRGRHTVSCDAANTARAPRREKHPRGLRGTRRALSDESSLSLSLSLHTPRWPISTKVRAGALCWVGGLCPRGDDSDDSERDRPEIAPWLGGDHGEITGEITGEIARPRAPPSAPAWRRPNSSPLAISLRPTRRGQRGAPGVITTERGTHGTPPGWHAYPARTVLGALGASRPAPPVRTQRGRLVRVPYVPCGCPGGDNERTCQLRERHVHLLSGGEVLVGLGLGLGLGWGQGQG